LAKVLQYNTTLKKLKMASNMIGNEGAAALADMLDHNTTVTSLDISSNFLVGPGGSSAKKRIRRQVRGNRFFVFFFLPFLM